MSNFENINENYSSDLINDLLNQITPEEQQQTDIKMQLAAKIFAALKARGWKSLDLARALNIKSPSLVSKWLSGTHNFTVDTLVDIQRILNIQLLNVEPVTAPPGPNTKFTVLVKSTSLREEIQAPLQRVIDESGEARPTAAAIEHL